MDCQPGPGCNLRGCSWQLQSAGMESPGPLLPVPGPRSPKPGARAPFLSITLRLRQDHLPSLSRSAQDSLHAGVSWRLRPLQGEPWTGPSFCSLEDIPLLGWVSLYRLEPDHWPLPSGRVPHPPSCPQPTWPRHCACIFLNPPWTPRSGANPVLS